MTFADAVALVDRARTPDDLFGSGQPSQVYRRLARLLHPDTAPKGRVPAATAAFARLSTLWAQHEGRLTSVLFSRRHRYTVGARVAAGDLANLYAARVDGDDVLIKIPRQPADNDLLEREATALSTLDTRGDPRYRAYVPRLVESFRHETPATGARRTVNVVERCTGFVSLERVRAAYPLGVDPRDVAWMWRRLLVALGHAHRAGIVHGAVVPAHVLIHPGEHGLVLVDWCYSVHSGQSVPAMVASQRGLYPPEVPAREPATPATDIYLASRCVRLLMGRRAHPPLLRFLDGCTLAAARMRPQDAWTLLAELDELLDTLYGPRTFRPFPLFPKEAHHG